MSLKKLDSRKLIIGVVSAALIIVNDLLGGHVSDTALYAASGILGACIIGLGIADAGAAKAAITSVIEDFAGTIRRAGDR